MADSISSIIQGVIGVAGLLIAGLVYLHSRMQNKESWLRVYKELHETFWADSDFREVRLWLACESAYQQIQPIIKRRQSDKALVSKEDYHTLEKLDKFLNFLMRVITTNPEFNRRKDLWDKLYFHYWLEQFSDPTRPELKWYLNTFYLELDKMLARHR